MAKYFDEPGEANTAHCLNIAMAEARDNGYRYFIVATTTGETGAIFAEGFKDTGVNLIVVTYPDGDGNNNISEINRKKIVEGGATLFNAPSIAPLVDKTFRDDCPEGSPASVVKKTLSRFGQGMSVCCEGVMSATDGGLLQEGLEVVSVAGTLKGADTVAVIRAASSRRFRELKVLEILAKPRA